MKVLTCAATRRRLEAFHDGELPVGDQIAVGSHLEWCGRCAESFEELQSLRQLLRAATPNRFMLSPEEDASLQRTIVSRAEAEQSLSFGAVARDMFEDMHFVYAGLGAMAAAFVCAVIMLGMMRAVTARAIDPLVAGSNQNPLFLLGGELQLPRAIGEEGFGASAALDGDDVVFAFTAVVTREGRVANVALLPPAQEGSQPSLALHHVNEVLGAASRARFEPASRAGSPVAVNMVWIVAHTTVRGNRPAAKSAPGRSDSVSA